MTIKQAKTARGVLNGTWIEEIYSPKEKEILAKAKAAYAEYAGNIYTHEAVAGFKVKDVVERTEAHIKTTGHLPIVVVDYLQILAPHDPRATEKMATDHAVTTLKKLSRDYHIPVIVISSFNRTSYESEISMQSFKESGGIEYTADFVAGLQFEGVGKKFDREAAKLKDPRELELLVVKNRSGKAMHRIQYSYKADYNYFQETGEGKKN